VNNLIYTKKERTFMKIKELSLYTNKLREQKEFYTSVIGLKLLNENIDSFTLSIGSTKLTFMESNVSYNYHFAINIPSNKIAEGADWLEQKVEIQKFNGDEIVKFPNWNANAIYFYDGSKNIVEFIARKNLNINSKSEFSKNNFISVSEIGVPTVDVQNIYSQLNRNYKLEKYDCEDNIFCAVGDEGGLFIIIDHTKKKWIPNMDDAKPNPFEITFENQEKQLYKFRFENETIINK